MELRQTLSAYRASSSPVHCDAPDWCLFTSRQLGGVQTHRQAEQGNRRECPSRERQHGCWHCDGERRPSFAWAGCPGQRESALSTSDKGTAVRQGSPFDACLWDGGIRAEVGTNGLCACSCPGVQVDVHGGGSASVRPGGAPAHRHGRRAHEPTQTWRAKAVFVNMVSALRVRRRRSRADAVRARGAPCLYYIGASAGTARCVTPADSRKACASLRQNQAQSSPAIVYAPTLRVGDGVRPTVAPLQSPHCRKVASAACSDVRCAQLAHTETRKGGASNVYRRDERAATTVASFSGAPQAPLTTSASRRST